ncbi:MAG: hypothetical protein GY794_16660 [bacterium]|nr:hypothetical protein [bacterium]
MNDKIGYKFSIFRLIATTGIVYLIWFMLPEGGGIYFHIPSMVFPFGVCFFLMLGLYGKEYLAFIPASLLVLVSNPSRADHRHAEIAKNASKFVIAAGVVFGLMDVMRMLPYLYDPGGLGMGMSVSMVPVFHAILASELFLAMVYRAFTKPEPDAPTANPLPMSNLMIPVIVFGFMIGLSFVLLKTCSSSWSW